MTFFYDFIHNIIIGKLKYAMKNFLKMHTIILLLLFGLYNTKNAHF